LDQQAPVPNPGAPTNQATLNRTNKLIPLIAIGAVAVVTLIAVGGYLATGTVIASADRRDGDKVLEQARQDNNTLYGLLKPPSFNTSFSTTQDYTQDKNTANDQAARFKHAYQVFDGDLNSLRPASNKLRNDAGSFLLLPQRSSLNQEQSRVDGVVAAFTAADQFFRIGEDQMRFTAALFNSEGALIEVVGYLDRKDAAGALARYSQVEDKAKQVVDLSKDPNIPPQLQSLATAWQTFVVDYRGAVQAISANDYQAGLNALSKIEADQRNIENFDQAGFTAYEDKLFKTYVDRYNAGLKQAGINVTA
jgi:hypothetical protein